NQKPWIDGSLVGKRAYEHGNVTRPIGQSGGAIQRVAHEAYVAGADTNAALPDELNTVFSRFEHNDHYERPRKAPEDNEGYVLQGGPS
ncbi:unnamed protein product, partial [Coregonus sp. 'balchen']